MDKYREMQIFTAVNDAGSFVGASETLGLSKAAVSRTLSGLEQRLGVRLLNRSTRHLSLTPEGALFLARCREILSSINAAEAELSMHRLSASGTLKATAPLSFGVRHLAPLWDEFLSMHPDVRLDLELSDRVVDLVDEGFDLAIRIGKLPDSGLVSRKLASTRLVLCAAPAYLARRGVPPHPEALMEHDIVGYSLLTTGDTWLFEGPDGPVSVRVSPQIRVNNGDTGLAIAVCGRGIHLWPSFLVEADLRSGALVEILKEFRAPTFDISAVYPSRKHVLPKIRVAVDFFFERFSLASWMTV